MWQLRQETLQLLDARLSELSPELIVEAGSGVSTELLSRHARTVSLEHLAEFAQRSRRLAPAAEIRLCAIRPFDTEAGSYAWYDTQLPAGIDFVLVDGPPGLTIGRQAALFAVWPYLSEQWELWLDDTDRTHEQECLTIWRRHFPIETLEVSSSVTAVRPR